MVTQHIYITSYTIQYVFKKKTTYVRNLQRVFLLPFAGDLQSLDRFLVYCLRVVEQRELVELLNIYKDTTRSEENPINGDMLVWSRDVKWQNYI